MPIARNITRWGAARLSRRLAVSVPYFGAAVALLTLGAAIRRKGMLGGSLDTGLNAVPFVGAAKNVIEIARGTDFIRDRQRPGAASSPGPTPPNPGGQARATNRPRVSDRLRNIRL